uniref:RNA-directed DNA polymerase n=1 Tax=Clastoptera arizonana TaxID=38151 RepID=A0A1B6DI21_9HEMI
MNIHNNDNELPYILDPKTNLKILIDTGSTKSFIKKELGFQLYKNTLNQEPFEVSTAHGTSKEKYCCKLPLLGKKEAKFYLFNFHKDFDILLGLDNIKELKIKLDFTQNKLNTPDKQITILYFNTEKRNKLKSNRELIDNNIKSFLIQSRSKRIIKIRVKNICDGQGVVPYVHSKGLEIPQCIVNVINGEALCPIINNTMKDIKITPKTLEIEPLKNFEIIGTPSENNEKLGANFNSVSYKNNKLNQAKLRTDHMNSEEKREILKLLKEYSDIFHNENNNLTFTNQIKHVIRTSDEIPVYTRNYRYPEIYRKEVNVQIQDMLKQKIIRPSRSPWNSPIWIVPKKKDASNKQRFRLVIDFRGLNAKTIDDRFPLPNITDILDRLGRSQYFTTLDLASGFHQVEMHPDSVEKTAFSTETGHYEFLRMPFGLKNSPPTFQRIMNNILRGIQNETCLVYLDDIIIYSTHLQEHIKRLREVFDRLRKANFKIQIDKAEFLRKEVAYLGHIVTPDGVKPNPDKIKAIKNYPIPKTTKQIKGFLGLLGYYRKFIKDFAKITKPFTNCLKSGATIDINNQEYLNCFEICKNILCNEPLLQYPDFEKEFILTTDASNFAIGAILSQQKNGSDLPVAYASRTLNKSETNYSAIEKELLAIVWATKYFRPYLFGRKFKVYTDHKPLQWLFSVKEPNSKLLRWRLKLEEFDYEIKYKNGKLNKNADALSRIQLNITEKKIPYSKGSDEEECDLDEIIKNATRLHFPDEDQSMIVNYDAEEEDSRIHQEREEESDQTVHSNFEGNTQIDIPILNEPVNFGNNQVFISLVKHQTKSVKIEKLFGIKKMRLLVEISESNFEEDIINFVKEFLVPNVKYSLYFIDDCYEKFTICMSKNFKHSQLNLIKCNIKLLDVTNEEEISNIINSYHTSKTNHRGIQETYERIKRIYYWPNVKLYIQNFINNCDVCLKAKYERTPLKLQMNLTPTPTKPLQIIHIDCISVEKSKFLSIVDAFSRYGRVFKLRGAQATEVSDNLLDYFAQFGIPETIVSDNGTEFNNRVVKEIMQLHKIQIHFTSTQNPSSNGICERFHSTLIEHIRLLNNQDEFKKYNIEKKLKYAIIAYNNSIHSATKLTPFEVLYGHIDTNPILDVEIEHKIINDYVLNHKEKTKKLYENIRELNGKDKANVQTKRNLNKESLPEIPKDVYVKNVQKQSKTKNKYNKEELLSVNKERKTAQIKPRHYNTKQKIHLSKIKRPRKINKLNPNLNPVPGPSCSSHMPLPMQQRSKISPKTWD